MLALRRSSTKSLHFRASGLNAAAFRACAGVGVVVNHEEDKSSASEPHLFTPNRWISSKTCNGPLTVPKQFSAASRYLSTKAGAKKVKDTKADAKKGKDTKAGAKKGKDTKAGAKKGEEEDDDLEDGFSELETIEGDAVDSDDESDSESGLSDIDTSLDESLETDPLGDAVADEDKKALEKTYKPSPLLKLVFETNHSLPDALDKYAEDKELCAGDVYRTMLKLRKNKLFMKALQLSEWLEKQEKFEFTERDYASRIDLIAKVRGVYKAESYVNEIPKSFREELVYRTLLANFVAVGLVNKAETLFNKMKDMDFPMSAFSYNQLLLLYKRCDKRKVADILLMMEKEDVKPSLFTYHVLIDIKGQTNDIEGMEKILETMKAEGIEPDERVQASLARHYAYAGLKEKAEAVLKEMEDGADPKSVRYLTPLLLPLYANLGNTEDVERIWKNNQAKPRLSDFFAAIDAFGKLKDIKQAEAIFDQLTKTVKKLSARHYTLMLQVYAQNKMLSKGKELLKRMGDSGCVIGATTLDSVVKLYVDAGEVEKADSILQKAVQQNRPVKPLFISYMTILDQYAKRGDVHNAEKIFHRMRQAGYVSRARPFFGLLNAYKNAKVPAYGIRERMKADNVFPNKGLADQLSQVDAFKKTAVSELLE